MGATSGQAVGMKGRGVQGAKAASHGSCSVWRCGCELCHTAASPLPLVTLGCFPKARRLPASPGPGWREGIEN